MLRICVCILSVYCVCVCTVCERKHVYLLLCDLNASKRVEVRVDRWVSGSRFVAGVRAHTVTRFHEAIRSLRCFGTDKVGISCVTNERRSIIKQN